MKPTHVLPTAVTPGAKRIVPVALVVLFALPAATRAQCPVGATGAGPSSMVLRLAEGETRRAVSTSDETTTQTIMGQEQTSHQVTTMGTRFDVLGPSADGQRRVRITYDSIHVEAATPMGGFTWDSSDSAQAAPPGAQLYGALVGQGYTVAMDPDGSNRHVEGWDSLLNHLVGSLTLPPGADPEEMKNSLKTTIGENVIGNAMSGTFVVMPSKAAAVGDSWSCTSHTGGNMAMTNKSTWTVTGRRGGLTKVNVVSEMATDSTASMTMGTVSLHYALKGTGTGTLEIEDATGWIVRSRSESQFSGTVMVEGSPMGPMEMPMTGKVVTTTEPAGG